MSRPEGSRRYILYRNLETALIEDQKMLRLYIDVQNAQHNALSH